MAFLAFHPLKLVPNGVSGPILLREVFVMLVPNAIPISMTDGYDLFNGLGQTLELTCAECKSPLSPGHGDKDAERRCGG